MARQVTPKKPLPVIYISGPMSGHENSNFPAFNEAARKFRNLGFPVLNPADFGDDPKHTWQDCLKRDIATMCHADAIVLLDGWDQSKGANLELAVAEGLGLRVVYPFQVAQFASEFVEATTLVEAILDDNLRAASTFEELQRAWLEYSDDTRYLSEQRIPEEAKRSA